MRQPLRTVALAMLPDPVMLGPAPSVNSLQAQMSAPVGRDLRGPRLMLAVVPEAALDYPVVRVLP